MRQLRPNTAARALTLATALAAMSAGCSPDNGTPRTIRPPTTEVEVLREIQLTDQARLPEQDVNLVDVEVGEDFLVFIYNNPVTEIPVAVDDVVSGVLHDGYLRRLTEVSQESPTRIRATTVHAELGELIGDGHFRVVFHPGDGVGEYALPEDEDLGVSREALSSGWSVFSPELRGFSCGGGAGGSLTVTPRFDVDLGMEVDVDIRWSTRWGIPPVRGELEHAIFALSGDVETGLTVQTSTNQSFSCSYNLLELARARGLMVPKRKWTTTFAVGPVPVVLTHNIEPSASISIGGEIETGGTTASATGRIGIRAGTEYTRAAGWQTIWEPSRSATTSLNATMPGRLSIMGTFSAGIGYTCRVYDVAGPGFSFGPRVAATFSVSPDRFDWMADVKGGLELSGTVDLQIPVIDYKLASYTISQVVGEETWATAMGTFPWCRDAGQPDGGTTTRLDGGGGGVGPRDGGGGVVVTGDGGGSTSSDGGGSTSIDGSAGGSSDGSAPTDGMVAMPDGWVCGTHGGPCMQDDHCCAGHQCIASACRDPALCGVESVACTSGAQCCGGLSCLPNSFGGSRQCCVGISGGRCESASDCCGEMTCEGGACVDRPAGASCASTSDCRGALSCVGGTCR
jgi:hypothetical protein